MPKDNVSTDGNEDELQDEVIDLFAKDINDKELIASESSETDELEPTGDDTPASTDAEDDIPDKFKGKSVKDIIDSYENLEREFGRRNNEVGELRSQVNTIVQHQLAAPTSNESTELTADQVLENPGAAVAKAVSEDPEIREIKEALVLQDRKTKLADFNDAHPDADKVIADPRFVKWIQASPARVRLYNEADAKYDYPLAAELLTAYKAVTGVETEASAEQRESDMKALKSPAPAGNGGGGKKRKMFKRSDLMKLKQESPDRYERLQPEILKAYAENRVLRDA